MKKYIDWLLYKQVPAYVVLLLVIVCLLLVGCTIPKNPSLTLGKKCVINEDSVAWSYVWLYDKEKGFTGNKENCEQIADIHKQID